MQETGDHGLWVTIVSILGALWLAIISIFVGKVVNDSNKSSENISHQTNICADKFVIKEDFTVWKEELNHNINRIHDRLDDILKYQRGVK